MPHGDLSDWTAIALFGSGIQQIFWPAYSFMAVGPLKAFVSGSFEAATPEGARTVSDSLASHAQTDHFSQYVCGYSIDVAQVHGWLSNHRGLHALHGLVGPCE